MKKGCGSSNDNGAMGLLLVLFPQDNNNNNNATIADKSTKINFPSSLLSKAQSTISICALLLFTTLLLFTLSTIPNTPPSSHHHRFLLHKPPSNLNRPQLFALQRMGTLFRRGSRPMPDLILCHVSDDTSLDDFRFFLRLLHRSNLTALSDIVFIFASHSSNLKFAPIVREENDAFSSILQLKNLTRSFFMGPKPGEPLWGKSRIESNFSTESLSYGSVLSFDASELDPENSLAGFLDRVPLSLRRWACYPMLLGRVRHSFKHVMLVDVKSVLILKDPLGRVRNRGSDSVFLFAKTHHGKKSHTQTKNAVLPAVVMGGARGVRRFSNAMLVEIVRAAIQHKKKKNSVSESVVLSQLVGNEFMLRNKNVNLITSTESIPEASSLAGHNSDSPMFAIVQRVGNHDLNSVIRKQLCSTVVDSSVYRDC